MRHPREIETELREILNKILKHRESLQSLEHKRLELIKELRSFSSSITSTSIVGKPGIIQGEPPNGK